MNDTVKTTLTSSPPAPQALMHTFASWKISSGKTNQSLLSKKLAKIIAPLKQRRKYRWEEVLLTHALLKQDCKVCFFKLATPLIF